MNDNCVVAFSTFPDRETAERIARELVQSRLVACANIIPSIHSLYVWNAKLEESSEVLAMFKLPDERYQEFEATLHALHPYDVPEIIRLDIAAGSPDYLRWVKESCARS